MSRAILTVDLGYGDSGKGTVVDYLVRENGAATVVRFNGGAQAAHTVFLPDGRHHTFSQFGSGTYVPGVSTFLSQYVLVNPSLLIQESEILKQRGVDNPLDKMFVDERALVTTPIHRAANRLKEIARGDNRLGSCGLGIGETMEYFLSRPKMVIRISDLKTPKVLHHKLEVLRYLKLWEVKKLDLPRTEQVEKELSTLMSEEVFDLMIGRLLSFPFLVQVVGKEFLPSILQSRTTVFEAAQGILLDEWYGFHPYTTWSSTTFKNALALLREARFNGKVEKVGIMRTYMTRHGPGPFVTENKELTDKLPDSHNKMSEWQREFRVGHLDLAAIRYALEVVDGVDYIALTHMDKVNELKKICTSYRWVLKSSNIPDLNYQGELTQKLMKTKPQYISILPSMPLVDTIELYLKTPVGLISYGPTYEDKSPRPVKIPL